MYTTIFCLQPVLSVSQCWLRFYVLANDLLWSFNLSATVDSYFYVFDELENQLQCQIKVKYSCQKSCSLVVHSS